MKFQIKETEDGKFAVGKWIKDTSNEAMFLVANEFDSLQKAEAFATELDKDDGFYSKHGLHRTA